MVTKQLLQQTYAMECGLGGGGYCVSCDRKMMEYVVMLGVLVTMATGSDTLRCLAMATVDKPIPKEDLNLEDSTKFAQYEVQREVGVVGTAFGFLIYLLTLYN